MPIAFGRRPVLLYLNARNALRETAANLAHINNPKPQPGARQPPSLGTQLLLPIVDCEVVQHDNAPGHYKILEHHHLQIHEDHIPSKVHRVKHNQPLDRAKRSSQQATSRMIQDLSFDTHGSWPFHLNSRPRLTIVGITIATAPPSDL
jgi:hypothetical protein